MSTPAEMLLQIPSKEIKDTPLEVMQGALLAHFEEDREMHKEVLLLAKRMDPEAEEYVLKPLIPYMQGAAGIGILWKFFMVIGGGLIMWGQIKGYFSIK